MGTAILPSIRHAVNWGKMLIKQQHWTSLKAKSYSNTIVFFGWIKQNEQLQLTQTNSLTKKGKLDNLCTDEHSLHWCPGAATRSFHRCVSQKLGGYHIYLFIYLI